MRPGLQSEMIRSELEDVVGEHFISTRDTDLAVYATDWSWMAQMWLDRGEELRLPDYIVHPGTVEEVSDILKIANGYRIPVIPFGGGSGTQGSALPLHGGIMLDTKRLSAIIEIDEKSLKVTTQAGIINTQLEWALNEHNLTYPHYPASGNCATMAGFLAARGTGTISTKYGKAEDMVLSMQVVLPNGDIIRTPCRTTPRVPTSDAFSSEPRGRWASSPKRRCRSTTCPRHASCGRCCSTTCRRRWRRAGA